MIPTDDHDGDLSAKASVLRSTTAARSQELVRRRYDSQGERAVLKSVAYSIVFAKIRQATSGRSALGVVR